jgi:hypothetical protein
MLDRAYQWSDGGYNVHHAEAFVTTGQWTLFVVSDDDNRIHGAVTVNFSSRPGARVAFVTGIGGTGVVTRPAMHQFKQALAAMGATTIEAVARASVTRLLRRLSFTPKRQIIGVDL